jgi:hypothetical protein
VNDEVDKNSSWELQPGLHDVLDYLMTMSLFPLLPRDMGTLPTPIPTHGLVISTVLSMLTMAILAICLSELHDTYASHSGAFLKVKLARRIQATKNWAKVPLTRWRMTIYVI